MQHMKAAVLVEPHRFEVRDMPIPAIGPSDALIKVERCGICGTDMHMFNGHYATDKLPIIPGHEFSGTIAALGADVVHLKTGMRVVADINIGCGNCFYCRCNEILNCAEMRQVGISRDGGFAEYVSLPARLVIPTAPDAEFDLLALVEPAACVVRAARKAVLDAEGRECVSGTELVQLQTELTRAEENAVWLAAELDALNELQVEHLKVTHVASR